MKAIFYDASSLQIQKVETIGGSVRFLVIGESPDDLRKIFEDITKTKVIKVEDRGQPLGTYENYTEYDHTELYPGGILGVVNNKVGKSTEERLSDMEKDVEEIKESGGVIPENYGAVFTMAKMSAEDITDDEKALKVKDLYDTWSGDSVEYKAGKYLLYNDVLYKVLKDHTSQETWTPDTASSLYSKVLIDPSGEILPWEQPDSTNPYMKGNKVTHNGKTWESEVDNNVWEPGTTGAPWKEVKE